MFMLVYLCIFNAEGQLKQPIMNKINLESKMRELHAKMNRLSDSTMNESIGNSKKRNEINGDIAVEFDGCRRVFNALCEKYEAAHGRGYIDWLAHQNFKK